MAPPTNPALTFAKRVHEQDAWFAGLLPVVCRTGRKLYKQVTVHSFGPMMMTMDQVRLAVQQVITKVCGSTDGK